MALITVVFFDETVKRINAAGANLLSALRSADVYIPAICGAQGSCGKCAVRLLAGSLPETPADKKYFTADELNAGWRLACAAFPADDVTITIPENEENNFEALTVFSNGKSGGKYHITDAPQYGIACDIGTTTLAFALVNLENGEAAGRYAEINRQREYGADVISRIQRANGGDLPALCMSIRRQIARGTAALCKKMDVPPQRVRRMVITGNTVMLHLLLGLDCHGLGRAPFTPETLALCDKSFAELFESAAPPGLSCAVTILPGISAFIGADITAGIYFTRLGMNGKCEALLDIGTNGEIALACGGKIFCAATAAGPAFEGGNIRWGCGSVPGAVTHAEFHAGGFQVKTIGGGRPAGICGAGLIDIVSEGLKHGLIASSGRFNECVPPQGIGIARSAEGRDITLCQKDVRELQLAKSAIRSGLDALLNHAGISYHDIQKLYLAGGFGFSLNSESAAAIGLIPRALLPKIAPAGNSSLGGAAQFLQDSAGEAAVCEIAARAETVNLSEDEYFKEQFIENINFE